MAIPPSPVPSDILTIWTVFYNPADFPGQYVLRAFHEVKGSMLVNPVAHTADSLEAIRAKVPPGCIRIPAMPGDDPAIVEAWF